MPIKGINKVKQALNEAREEKERQIGRVIFKGFREVQKPTPVDEGTARANWFLSVGTPSARYDKDKKTPDNIRMPTNIFGSKLYYTNNTPYIGKLVYGGYKLLVKKGTYNKHKKAWEIRSIRGYSKQAPNGWVTQAVDVMLWNLSKL